MSRAASAISWGLAYIDRRRGEKQDAERERIETALFVRMLDAKLDTLIQAAVRDRGKARDVIRAHRKAYEKERKKAGLVSTPGEEAKHTPTPEQERRAMDLASQLPVPKRLRHDHDYDSVLDACRAHERAVSEHGRNSEEATDAARAFWRAFERDRDGAGGEAVGL